MFLGIFDQYSLSFDRPAISRITVSSPQILRPLTTKKLAYSDRVKPSNFVLAAHVAKLGHPDGVDPKQFQLIAPFTNDSRQWLKMRWTDIYSGKSFGITTQLDTDPKLARVKSYGDVFEEYRTNPEPKSAGISGKACSRSDGGLLRRRHVRMGSVVYVGIESNFFEEVDAGIRHDWDGVQAVYENHNRDPWKQTVLPILPDFSRREVAARVGISPRHVSRVRNGWQNPEPETRARMTRAVADLIRSDMGDDAPDDDLGACVAYARWKQARKVR